MPAPAFEIRADQPDTWNRNRPLERQWMLAGHWVPGQPETMLTGAGLPAGTWVDDNTIESFPLPDGKAARLQLSTGFNGLPVVVTSVCHVDDGSYQYQEGATNTSVNSPPSDPLMFDAPRAQLDLGEAGFNIADPFRVVTVFQAPEWVDAHHNMTAVWELHDVSGGRKSGPIMGSIHDGHLWVVGKRGTLSESISTPNLPNGYSLDAGPIEAGEIVAVVWEIHMGKWLRLTRVYHDREEIIVDETTGWGWAYGDQALNTRFRVHCFKTYPFLRWHPDFGDWKTSGVINWDPAFGPIRRFAHVGFAADPSWSQAEAVDWARARLPSGGEVPPTDPGVADLHAAVAALRARADTLTADVDALSSRMDEVMVRLDGLVESTATLAATLAASVASIGQQVDAHESRLDRVGSAWTGS